ncbi:hypothetical protein C882_2353 [Caenispirillum salinarum AK4]|uniref:Ferric siderophore reductase C-terminal domain-containing protein n=1 Tax=Caenispirillum salinarum AK4 TaxID=1238182 RepID=K9HVL7_9PROT|nr:siderophore ferric iron reductase [Caenispirillum salinarum]EKV32276.1 hypothetical protein C882_2353 [Caenispirillum salinarum AK4]
MPAPAHDLGSLVTAMESFVPGLGGRIGPPSPGQIVAGADNRDAVRRLVDGIAAHSPEAGRAYWAVRAWGMLTWQPAVLAVLGVHGPGLVPRLDAMGQSTAGAAVLGFTVPEEGVLRAPPPALIREAGALLRRISDALLADLRGVEAMKPVLAGRLLADRVLGTLAKVAPEPDRHAEAWLQALGLAGQSGLVPLELSDGRRRHGLDRRACCLAFRVDGGVLCASCPKRPEAERLALMRMEWEDGGHVQA